MRESDIALGVDHAVQRHTPQLEKIDLLPVRSGYRVIRVRQADKRNSFILPILLKDGQRVRPNGQDLRAAAPKLVISIPQARQLRAAVRSHETAQE